jgi:hypothetical protein
MEELAKFCVVLVVLSCGLSIMMGPLFGKKGMDPFIILRPVLRNLRIGVVRMFCALSKGLKDYGKQAWRNANMRTRHPIIRFLLYVGSTILYGAGLLIALPAYALGSMSKK